MSMAFMLASAAALVQAGQPTREATPPPADDIVVEGRRDTVRSIRRETRRIARNRDGQLSRFEEPVCPLAIGLPRAISRAVEARIRFVASQVGARVAPLPCRANLTMIVASDGHDFLTALANKRSILFGTLPAHEFRRLQGSSGPVWTWQQTLPKRRDGGPVEFIGAIGDPPRRVAKGAYVASNVDLSRLTSPVRLDTGAAFVLLSLRRVGGMTVRQIADFSAMVGLAGIKDTAPDDLDHDSILTAYRAEIAATQVPPEATAFDIAYLDALYSGESGFTVDRKTAAMAGQIERTLSGEAP